MKHASLAWLVAIVVFAAVVVPSAIADAPKDRDTAAKEKWQKMSAEKREKAMFKAENKKMFGKWNYTADGNATGKHLKFHFTNSTGAIDAFTVFGGNTSFLFFTTVTPTPYTPGEKPFDTGAVLHLPSPTLAIRAHNNPTATTTWMNSNNTTSLTFALGAGVNVTGNASKDIRLDLGALHAHLMTNGNATPTIGNGSITYALGANEKVMFRAHPTHAQAHDLHDQNAAFLSGKFGAQVNLVNADGDAVDDAEESDITTDVTAIGKGHIVFKADGNVTGARVVFFTIDGDTIDAGHLGSVLIKLRGVAVVRVNTSADVVSATTPVAAVSSGDDSVQIAVNVDHFSSNEITIDQAAQTTPAGSTSPAKTSKPAPGFDVLLLIGALGALVALGRRRAA